MFEVVYIVDNGAEDPTPYRDGRRLKTHTPEIGDTSYGIF